MKNRRSILIVAMIDSPHTARWVDLIADEDWDIHFFPVCIGLFDSLLRNVTIHYPWLTDKERIFFEERAKTNKINIRTIYQFPFSGYFYKVINKFKKPRLGESDVRSLIPFGPQALARLIQKLKPDLIHSMEFQHASYLVLNAKGRIKNANFPKWMATNWGSDIYYYKRFTDHHLQITRLLKNIDYYSCECHRDLTLAEEMGLKAKHTAVLPNTGGFDINKIAPIRHYIKPSKRSIILIKGYQHFAGRALTALDVLTHCVELLTFYKIYVYSASKEIYPRIYELQESYGLDIEAKQRTTHDEMLRLFSYARVYLGVSISDAISTSMLEAMAMGAFPIQTNTSCCDEWIQDGKTGFSIPADDTKYIASRLREALTNDALVDSAAEMNWSVICNKLDKLLIKDKQISLYNRVFDDIGGE